MNKEFDNEPVYGDNDKYIWTRIKLYGDKINTNFHGKKMPKENESYKCLSLIMLESVIKGQNKKYYPQTLLKECKYEIKRRKSRTLLMMILIQACQMNLIMKNLMINLLMMNLKVKIVF